MNGTDQSPRVGPQPGRPWASTWSHLVSRTLQTGACTGCAGCVIACPREVLSLDERSWVPRLAEAAQVDGDAARCVYAERGCTMCARVCPRLGAWEQDGDVAVRGRARAAPEVLGIYRRISLVSATDPAIAAAGQDGGLATALLVYALEHDLIDAAVVSFTDPGLRPRPGVARTRSEVLAAAGSRYTYSPNTLAVASVARLGADRLGLVSVGCQASVPAVALSRGARRLARRFALTIGLLCSRTFTDALFHGLLEPRFGIGRAEITRMNIKGRLQVWTTHGGGDGPDVEVPLKECDPFDRPGCRRCPDFTAEHADLSLGGIGRHPGTTLAIVRSDRGADLLEVMERDGWIGVRDAGEEDPDAVALVTRMAARQRRRWAALAGEDAAIDPAPGMLPDD